MESINVQITHVPFQTGQKCLVATMHNLEKVRMRVVEATDRAEFRIWKPNYVGRNETCECLQQAMHNAKYFQINYYIT